MKDDKKTLAMLAKHTSAVRVVIVFPQKKNTNKIGRFLTAYNIAIIPSSSIWLWAKSKNLKFELVLLYPINLKQIIFLNGNFSLEVTC